MLLRRLFVLVFTCVFEVMLPFGMMYAMGLMPMWIGLGAPDTWPLRVFASVGGIIGGLLFVAWVCRSLGSDLTISEQALQLAQVIAIGGGMSLGSFQGAQWWQPEVAPHVPVALISGLLGTIVVAVIALLRRI